MNRSVRGHHISNERVPSVVENAEEQLNVLRGFLERDQRAAVIDVIVTGGRLREGEDVVEERGGAAEHLAVRFERHVLRAEGDHVVFRRRGVIVDLDGKRRYEPGCLSLPISAP